MMKKRTFLRAMVAGAGAGAVPMAFADEAFPSQPIRLVVGFAPGGATDVLARAIANRLSAKYPKGVIVDNRVGAGGTIAAGLVANAKPDGYTLAFASTGAFSIAPSLFAKLPYDPAKDFDTLLPLFKTHFFFTVGTGSKYKTVGDIVADAKARPGKLNYGSWSVGNPVHLGSELFESATGTQMEHVIFKETTQLYTSVSTGEIDFALGTAATAGPLYRAGKLRLLAFAGPQRSAEFPDVPTVAESGGPKDFAVTGWNAVAVPPGLPAAVAEKIRKDIEQALTGPEVAEKFKTFGYEQFPTTRAQFGQFVKDESQRFGDVIRKANVSLD